MSLAARHQREIGRHRMHVAVDARTARPERRGGFVFLSPLGAAPRMSAAGGLPLIPAARAAPSAATPRSASTGRAIGVLPSGVGA